MVSGDTMEMLCQPVRCYGKGLRRSKASMFLVGGLKDDLGKEKMGRR